MSAPVIGQRALNRALLARQGLLERRAAPVSEVVEALVGLQAQEPGDPYVALWSRITDFDPAGLATLLTDRAAVRMPLMRATIHLATTRDARVMRSAFHPVMERTLRSQRLFAAALAAVDREELLREARALVEGRPRTRAEIRDWAAGRWPGIDAASLAIVVTYLLPVLQVTPRGVWGQSGQATWTTFEAWVGEPPADPDPSTLDGLVRRYLAAFGPATPADIRAWCGLAGLGEVVDRMRPELRTFRDEAGRELLDVPEGILADPATPAPVRFLPVYDNVMLGHAERSRIVSRPDREAAMALGALNVGTLLVDGFAHGVWRAERDGDRIGLDVRLQRPLSVADGVAVSAEGQRLMAFLEPAADHGEVRFRDLSTA
jgi:hypothetical protein